ncbi:hypothetical protein ACTU6V_10695 [Microbacterium sp. A204]|uniref:hypothetical protein n=1 Tax=Microbacterium sp. A204 TaxID=3457321 RepID=UPI003FD19CA7
MTAELGEQGGAISHHKTSEHAASEGLRGGRNWQQIRAEDASAATARAWSHHRPGAA